MSQAPVIREGGFPVCPECQSSLDYMERSIYILTNPITSLKVETGEGNETFYMPVVSTLESESDQVENLESWIQCTNLECTWRLTENLGDVELA